METILTMLSATSQGLIWGVMVLGLYITFRILDFADLTVDGSLALGGSISAVLISNGVNPFLALLAAALAGAAAGCVTGLLHIKLKIPGILAGILTMIALYSVNIRVMGRANTPLLGKETIFTRVNQMFTGLGSNLQAVAAIVLGLLTCAVIITVLYWFFGTELGYAIRATGNNQNMVCALGINVGVMQIIALALSNGLIAFSGALVAQNQGYADINMGTGALVCGLAAIIIGETFMKDDLNFMVKLIFVVLGSILYRVIIAVALQVGMNPSDLKLFTAIIVAVALALPKFVSRKGALKC